jgi:hypothetical protein
MSIEMPDVVSSPQPTATSAVVSSSARKINRAFS